MLSGNMASQLIPFLLAPVLARIYSPEAFGVLANFMAIVGVIGIIATARLELAIPLPDRHERAQDIAFTGAFATLLIGFLSLALPFFSEQVGHFYKDSQLADQLWMAPVAIVSIGILGLSNNWSLRQSRFRSISVGKVVQSLANNGLAAVLGYIGWGIEGLITGWLISQFLNILVLLAGVDRKINRNDFGMSTVKSTVDEYRDFPLINSLHAFTDLFVSQFLLFWIISTQYGQKELGFFALMHRYVRAPIVVVTSSVSQLFYVEAGKALNKGTSALPFFFRTIRTTFLFSIPFTAILLFFGPTIFGWYLGEEWRTAGEYARCISPMLLLMFLVSPVSGTPILVKKQKTAFLFSVIGYSASLSALVVALKCGLGFEKALWWYSGVFCIYQCCLIIWYYNSLKSPSHASTD